jgi:Domain of unknown function (DUF4157)
MFASRIARSQTTTAARSANKLAPHDSSLVARFIGGSGESAPILQRRQIPLREVPGPFWDFSRIPIFPPSQQLSSGPLRLQPKLAVVAVNDPLEHEADRVAEQVMRMPDPDLSIAATPLKLRRKCAACKAEEEEKAQKLQLKPAWSARPAVSEAPPIVHEALRSPWEPLDAATRAFFEPRFGRDFGAVRIHKNATATGSARSLDAVAYTVGTHIIFADGQFQPHSQSGQNLIAHELAHVLQQDDGTSVSTLRRRNCGSTVRTCFGTCTAASGRIGTCIWTGITNGCVCRDQSSDEPGPSQSVVPSWLAALVGAAVVALIVACFATGVCEFGVVVGGLGAAAAAAVIAFLRASGIEDSGSSASSNGGGSGVDGATASSDTGATFSNGGGNGNATASSDTGAAPDYAAS